MWRVQLQEKCNIGVPAIVWGAQLLHANARTLAVGFTGEDYAGGLYGVIQLQS